MPQIVRKSVKALIAVPGFSPRSMDLTPKLDLVVLDCPDAMQWAHFYSRLLGWPVEDGADDAFATLTPRGGGVSPDDPNGRTTLAFQRIDDWVAPTWQAGRTRRRSTSTSASVTSTPRLPWSSR
jgi:hypothetical protein